MLCPEFLDSTVEMQRKSGRTLRVVHRVMCQFDRFSIADPASILHRLNQCGTSKGRGIVARRDYRLYDSHLGGSVHPETKGSLLNAGIVSGELS